MTAISVNHKEKDLKKMDYVEKIEFFNHRINGWYINIGKELVKIHDFGFGVLSINCILIDVLSQYYYGKKISDRNSFKDFLRKNIKEFNKRLPFAISNPPYGELKDFADVFYSGFRCGVLHNAKISFGEIESKNKYFLRFYKKKKRLHVNQNILLERLIKYFNNYILLLKKDTNKNNQITKDFWKKFNHDFKDQL